MLSCSLERLNHISILWKTNLATITRIFYSSDFLPLTISICWNKLLLKNEASHHQAWQSSRSTWAMLSGTWGDSWGCPMQGQQLDSMTLGGGPFQLSLLSGSMKDFPVSESDGIHLFIMKSAKAKDSFYHVFGETLIHGFEKLLINPISTIFQPISCTPVQSARSTCSPQCTGSNTTASKKQLWPLIYLYQYS